MPKGTDKTPSSTWLQTHPSDELKADELKSETADMSRGAANIRNNLHIEALLPKGTAIARPPTWLTLQPYTRLRKFEKCHHASGMSDIYVYLVAAGGSRRSNCTVG